MKRGSKCPREKRGTAIWNFHESGQRREERFQGVTGVGSGPEVISCSVTGVSVIHVPGLSMHPSSRVGVTGPAEGPWRSTSSVVARVREVTPE